MTQEEQLEEAIKGVKAVKFLDGTPITIFKYVAQNPSDWQVELFGLGKYGIIIRPERGSEPNCFWRWTQYLCFGNKWIRS